MCSRSCAVEGLVFAGLCAMLAVVQAQTAAEGAAVYERRCASCHRPGSPVAGPSLPTAVTYAYRRFSDEVRNGRDRPAPLIDMPAFTRTRLPDRDLCAVYLFVRSGRPEAAGDTAALCGLASAPSGPASAASSGSATPPPPPPPPDAALEASRRSFAPARTTPFRLQCRGGDSAAARVMPTGSGSDSYHWPWRYELEFFDWRSSTELRRASCIWLGAAPPLHGTGPYRVVMEWPSSLAPAFQRFSYRAVDNAIHVDLDRRILYSPVYREIVQAVSRPDAVFSFEVWVPADVRLSPATQLRVSAAAVRLGGR